jgi:tRNA1(Val) A37 N6-methylase TrmN6
MANHSEDPADEHACESLLLGGRVRLLQPRRGYRAGMDAALLAAAVEGGDDVRLLEAGCGPGAALLQAARRLPGACLVGVERDPEAFKLAQTNLVLNDLEGRVAVQEGDVLNAFRDLGHKSFDGVFANPPFFDDPAAIRGPHPAKRGAYIADGGLEAWIVFMLEAVKDGGAVTLVHRADRLLDCLRLLSPRAGSFQIRPVHSFGDAAAKRVLVRARRGGRGPLRLLSPLVMHERGLDGSARLTPRADQLLRGEDRLSWERD